MSSRDAARRLSARMPGGNESTAPRMGVTVTTWRHQLAGTNGYKLSLENAELLTQFAIEQHVDNPLEILSTFARNCGAMVLPLPGLYADGSATLEDLAGAAKEFGEFVLAVSSATADGKVTANELADVDKELAHLIGCAQRVRAGLAAIHERDKPKPMLDLPVREMNQEEV